MNAVEYISVGRRCLQEVLFHKVGHDVVMTFCCDPNKT